MLKLWAKCASCRNQQSNVWMFWIFRWTEDDVWVIMMLFSDWHKFNERIDLLADADSVMVAMIFPYGLRTTIHTLVQSRLNGSWQPLHVWIDEIKYKWPRNLLFWFFVPKAVSVNRNEKQTNLCFYWISYAWPAYFQFNGRNETTAKSFLYSECRWQFGQMNICGRPVHAYCVNSNRFADIWHT